MHQQLTHGYLMTGRLLLVYSVLATTLSRVCTVITKGATDSAIEMVRVTYQTDLEHPVARELPRTGKLQTFGV
jgi:hypothetical protein